jgi:hypothetical protein
MTLNRLSRFTVLALALGAAGAIAVPAVQAGPIVRRAQERRACQEFAGKLQAASGNPQQAQMVYQQGVLKLVERFGENPCGDIPAPVATQATPATAPAATPTATTPAATTPAASVKAPATAAPPSNPQQAQACQQFAGKLQAAQGNPAQAQQIYAMGTEKLSGMFGPNPCPNVAKP